MQARPIFLLSLPRAGSTLLQRMLAAHPEIAATAEPWLLLPLLYAMVPYGAEAIYGHEAAARAYSDFFKELPNGVCDYREAVRYMTETLYGKACKSDAKYFLDKTPRYAMIARQIVKTFPDAKYIFLWRNPLGMLASWITTFGNGRWTPVRVRHDYYRGLPELIAAYKSIRDRAIAVRYEDVVTKPQECLSQICEYLGVKCARSMLEGFGAVSFKGSFGDPKRDQYQRIQSASVSKWRSVLCNLYRKRGGRQYLEFLGEERLAVMGYSLDSLKQELASIPTRVCGVGTDVLYDTVDRLRYWLVDCVLFKKWPLYRQVAGRWMAEWECAAGEGARYRSQPERAGHDAPCGLRSYGGTGRGKKSDMNGGR